MKIDGYAVAGGDVSEQQKQRMVRPDHFEWMCAVEGEVQRRELPKTGGSLREHCLGGFQKTFAECRVDIVLLPGLLNDRIERRASRQDQKSPSELPCYPKQLAVILGSRMSGRKRRRHDDGSLDAISIHGFESRFGSSRIVRPAPGHDIQMNMGVDDGDSVRRSTLGTRNGAASAAKRRSSIPCSKEAVGTKPEALDALYAKPTAEMLEIAGRWMQSADLSGATVPQS